MVCLCCSDGPRNKLCHLVNTLGEPRELTHTYVCVCVLYMNTRDVLGRRRQQTQIRGLRSLFPKLPPTYRSRLLRIAMTHFAWAQLDELAALSHATTTPRAYGEVLERLLAIEAGGHDAPNRSRELREERTIAVAIAHEHSDWQTWQIQKERTLLATAWQRL